MSIRIPPKAEIDIRNAFEDIAEELRRLREAIPQAAEEVEAPPTPDEPVLDFFRQVDLPPADFKVSGMPLRALHEDGTFREVLDGVVKAVPPGLGLGRADSGGSVPNAPTRIVNVLGSLSVTGAVSAGQLVGNGPASIQVFTSGSGTYTTPTRATRLFIIVQGGGGGGAGVDGTGSQVTLAPGGGAGGYLEGIITSPASSYSYAVGAGGAGGAAGSNNGSAGGTSTFGSSLFTASGGSGSTSPASSASAHLRAGAAGGTATGGSLNLTGATGGAGRTLVYPASTSGDGASTRFGNGGQAPQETTNGGNAPSTSYGAGGAGAFSAGAGDRGGGDGAGGIIIVYEF